MEIKNMTQRLNYAKASPEGGKVRRHWQEHVDNCGIEHPLLELVKMRASQLNGCANCLNMHSKDARASGEAEQRRYLFNAVR